MSLCNCSLNIEFNSFQRFFKYSPCTGKSCFDGGFRGTRSSCDFRHGHILVIEEINGCPVLIRKLEKEMIIAYVPPQLLRELQSGRYKFYINGISESTYYSEQELTMWIDANEIIAKLYSRLVFTNIENCKANNTGTAIQQERVGLYNAMINRIKEAYKALKQQREIAAKSASVNKEPINTDDIFNSIDWSAFGNVTETTQNKEVEINKAV